MNEENKTIIRALNKYGRVPQQYELLNEIDRLNNIINELEEWVKEDVKEEKPDLYFQVLRKIDILDKLKELKENNNGK